MYRGRKKTLIYSFIALITLVFTTNVVFKSNNWNILETSILTLLKNVADENKSEPPDLAIEQITLQKIADPTDKFNYYQYTASIVVKNYGGPLLDGRIIINGGKNQKYSLVRNTDEGFSLAKNQTYIIRDYEIFFDGNYNGGEIVFTLDLMDEVDYDLSNNIYTYKIFELPAKLTSISIDEILDDNTLVLKFDSSKYSIRKHNFEIFYSDKAVFDGSDLKYAELDMDGNLYSYYRIKNSLENIYSDFTSVAKTELESHFVEFYENPFFDGNDHYVFVKTTNPENNYYAVSNLIEISPQQYISRAQFAKLFVDYSGIDLLDKGLNFYEDVAFEEWYGPYVQTLFNLGIFDTDTASFSPDEIVTRGEVLKYAMDYFDVDLATSKEGPHFEDVPENDDLYPYAEGLFASEKASAIRNKFHPEGYATKDYLNYLINEYSENN